MCLVIVPAFAHAVPSAGNALPFLSLWPPASPITVPPSFQNLLSLLSCILGPITLLLPATPPELLPTSLFFTRLTQAHPHQEAWLKLASVLTNYLLVLSAYSL